MTTKDALMAVTRSLPHFGNNHMVPLMIIDNIVMYHDLGNKCVGIIDINVIDRAKAGVMEVGSVPIATINENQQGYSLTTTPEEREDLVKQTIAEGFTSMCESHGISPVDLLEELIERRESIMKNITKN